MRPPRSRPAPRHRAPSGAVRPQAARTGQPGAGQPGAGQPGAEPPGAGSPATEPLRPQQPKKTAQPAGGHVGPALRRLMVTPTFAAGLGVVLAAGLAVSMTARTVLQFSGPGQGKPCAVRGCANGPDLPGGSGTLASAKPGVKFLPATVGPDASAQPSPSFTGGQSSPGSLQHADGQVVIDYQTTQRFSWGFNGQIRISGLPSSLSTWRLEFDYPGTSIVGVQGAQWQPTGQDSGVAEAAPASSPSSSASDAAPSGASSTPDGPSPSSGNPSGSSQDQAGQGDQQNAVVITITASGPPSSPTHCRFNNTPCSFH